MCLFINNYQQGDDQRLLHTMELLDESWDRHRMLLDLVKVLEQKESADSVKLGQIAYFHTPCSECRFYAAHLLHDRHGAPAWLMEECLTDANEDCHSIGQPASDLDDKPDEPLMN